MEVFEYFFSVGSGLMCGAAICVLPIYWLISRKIQKAVRKK